MRCVETLGGYFELNIFTNTLEHALQLHVLSRAGTNSMQTVEAEMLNYLQHFFPSCKSEIKERREREKNVKYLKLQTEQECYAS